MSSSGTRSDGGLNAWVAARRLQIFDDLRKGLAPSEGSYDDQALRDGRSKGQPQLGATHFAPDEVKIEFIYPDPRSASTVLTVRLSPPERIVFMPVPSWVVENIWQGEVNGSFHFESDALNMVDRFREQLSESGNMSHFGRQEPTRRE